MNETQFGIRKVADHLPTKELLAVPHNGKNLLVSYPAFCSLSDSLSYFSCNYDTNVDAMSKHYFHSSKMPNITFRPTTTAESISVFAYNSFNLAKRQILDVGLFQAGRIIITPQGVFVNPPIGKSGKFAVDRKRLNFLLNSAKKVNGIYLFPNNKLKGVRDFGFAPYESFKPGVQEAEVFVRGGLARVLEHTGNDVAQNLETAMSGGKYNSVNIVDFGNDTPIRMNFCPNVVAFASDNYDSGSFASSVICGDGEDADEYNVEEVYRLRITGKGFEGETDCTLPYWRCFAFGVAEKSRDA